MTQGITADGARIEARAWFDWYSGQPMTSITALAAPFTPLGFEKVTGLNVKKGLTVPGDARFAIIQAETQNVRWRDDGPDPTASVGYLLAVGNELVYDGNLAALEFIEVTASATLNVLYYR